ncbi:phosphoenolpyruvate-protein phosphotransferase [Caedimonas varicaedens]|uniref:phosphoenolpyruvate--protein phosphotransferase n=1 Tax=Caedimonas varicaedens TaxID=1629334 RepID=A0A0K8MEE2_9PROT|nr:phosphoenolpyruvate-protein phosphotransferase [Caedimonas varicaedens]
MTAQASTTSHRLLRRLRDIMGGADLSSQNKLDFIVKLIAADMEADVCSVYLVRGGIFLELFATHGLNLSMVHRLRLNIGEGVVGDVAANSRPLVLSDVKSHPSFKLIPQSNEEKLISFLAVPLNRRGKVIGVLTLQTLKKRLFTNGEVEILQTIAMVLSEMIVAGELINRHEFHITGSGDFHDLKLWGISLNPGLAYGTAVLHHPHIVVKQLISEDTHTELNRFDQAVQAMQESIKTLFSKSFLQNTEHREILETYEMFAHDRGWLTRIKRLIETGFTAEAAVQKVQRDLRIHLSRPNNSLLRDRLWDFEDLANRLLHHLLGEKDIVATQDEAGIIIVAHSLGSAELLEYENYGICGLVLEEGLQTAHVSIVARALNIPVVSRIPDVLGKIEPGEIILMDGNTGLVTLRPNSRTLMNFESRHHHFSKKHALAQEIQNQPAITLDGIEIDLYLNAGLLIDIEQLKITAAKGVGLYRTEIPFMMQHEFPTVETQVKLYSELRHAAGSHPVIFRTLDIGGDKALPYLRSMEDDNPVLGWRAIRIGLDRPMLLRYQLRALIQAAAGKELHLMFPMIAELEELLEAKRLLGLELERTQKHKKRNPPSSIKIGIMIEVPSIVWSLSSILPHVDFVSLGSNDLSQFFFAADRTNPYLADRYDVLSPSFLNILQHVAKTCKIAQKPLTLCGEMARNPLEAMALLMIGYRSLSMAPSCIGNIKLMIRSLNLKSATEYLQTITKKYKKTLRQDLSDYAKDHHIIY